MTLKFMIHTQFRKIGSDGLEPLQYSNLGLSTICVSPETDSTSLIDDSFSFWHGGGG